MTMKNAISLDELLYYQTSLTTQFNELKKNIGSTTFQNSSGKRGFN